MVLFYWPPFLRGIILGLGISFYAAPGEQSRLMTLTKALAAKVTQSLHLSDRQGALKE